MGFFNFLTGGSLKDEMLAKSKRRKKNKKKTIRETIKEPEQEAAPATVSGIHKELKKPEPSKLKEKLSAPEKKVEEVSKPKVEPIAPVAPAVEPIAPIAPVKPKKKELGLTDTSKPKLPPANAKDRGKDKKNIQKIEQKIEKDPTKIDIKGMLSLIKQLSPDASKYEDRFKEIDAKVKAIKSKKQSAKDKTAMAKVAESFAQALTQWGAGAYGQKHNVDMSGLRFNKADWESDLNRTLNDLDKEMGLLEQEKITGKKELSAEQEKIRRFAERVAAKDLDALRKLREIKAKQEGKGTGPDGQLDNIFTKELKKKLAKEGAEWITNGSGNTAQNIEKMSGAADAIQSGKALTGGMIGMVPKEVRAGVAAVLGLENVAAGVSAELDVASVIQQNLKQTLGGQFAQKEGEDVLKRSFYPGLPTATLVGNIRKMQGRLSAAKRIKDRLYEDMARTGKILTPSQVNDIMKKEYQKITKEQGPLAAPSKSETKEDSKGAKGLTPEEEKELAELEKELGEK